MKSRYFWNCIGS